MRSYRPCRIPFLWRAIDKRNGSISFVEMFAWKDTSSPELSCRSRRRNKRGGHRAPIRACVADDDPPPQAETRRPRRREEKEAHAEGRSLGASTSDLPAAP